MSGPDFAAMRAAAAELGGFLDSAVAIVEAAPDSFTPAERDLTHDLARSYIELARTSLERFEEAARGA